tara:strand:+ start:1244 stop:2224 length:981 start_codon:yes stop_codon:yes gene_type:complete
VVFKIEWERSEDSHDLPKNIIPEMLEAASLTTQVKKHHIVSGGCANLNIKLTLKGDTPPLILRLYLRDKSAALREKKTGDLLQGIISAPKSYFIGTTGAFCFAITNFIPGISLRNLLLGNETYDLQEIMFEIGTLLFEMQHIGFPETGFFDETLQVITPINRKSYFTFAKECLKKPTVSSQLPSETLFRLQHHFEEKKILFPDKEEKHLVHGDFDPSNIFVHKVKNKWKISGVLDWEFAYSGSTLGDIATLLRYAHQMPPGFTSSFLRGLTDSGLDLPSNWSSTVHLLNLLSLLDFLGRYDPARYPKRIKDILCLMKHIISELDKV